MPVPGTVNIKNQADGGTGIDITECSPQTIPPFRIFDQSGNLLYQIGVLGGINASALAQGVQLVSTTPVVLTGLNNLILVDTTAGAITLTLPAASVATPFGAAKTIVKVDSTTNAVTIQRAGADIITPEAYTSVQLVSQGESISLQSDGVSKWFSIPSSWAQNSSALRTVAATPYVVVPSDYRILVDATVGAFAVTLPAASAVLPGWSVGVKKLDSGGSAVTVSRAGADTIQGATTNVLAAQYNSMRYMSDGVGIWYLCGTLSF